MPYPEMLAALDKYVAYVKEKGYEGQINLTGGEPLLHPDQWNDDRCGMRRAYRGT